MKVLLAENDVAVHDQFLAAARAVGHEVVFADDEASLLDAVEREHPQLVVLSLDMPGVDGHALCRRLREHPVGASVYLLVITTRDDEHHLTAAIQAGADDYLTRPAPPHRLAARLTIAERRIAADAARRRAEEELARARWLAGIGETSIALQHEINNPLAALLGHAALIENGLVEPHEVRETLGVIVEQAQRIAAVVKRISALRNPQSVEYLQGARMIDLSRTDEFRSPSASEDSR